MKRLFKFVSSKSAILNMADGSLKFTPIDQLNDPSELLPIMDHDEVRTSLENLRQKGLNQEQFNWLRCQAATLDLLAPQERVLDAPMTLAEAERMLSISVYDDMRHMERKLFSTIESIRSKVGILSLSERYDSLPMWAHYADQARGYVVVLDDLDRSFVGDDTGSLNAPKPVRYTDRFIGMTFDPSTQDRLFFSKHSDWSYEREWRVVTALDACRMSSAGRLYSRDVDPLRITGVICGWRVGADDVLSLRNELSRVNPKAELMTAMLDKGNVTLSIE